MFVFIFLILLGLFSTGSGMDEDSYAEKGDSAQVNAPAKTYFRLTSGRAYTDDQKNVKRDGYRYYGAGSKSSNSFTPTNIHKLTSPLDTTNYFVTSKSSGVKDMDTAGSGTGTDGYLTVYEAPGQPSSGGMMMGSGGSGTGNRDSAYQGMMMDEGYGSMMSETGHGGGYGHGHGGYGLGGKGCNSALGLLGVLGLAAYLQNVLRNMNATGRRRKRDIDSEEFDALDRLEKVRNGMVNLEEFLEPLNTSTEDMELDQETNNKIMRDVFPLMSAVAHAREKLIPIHCTHSSVCLANQILVRDLGPLGHTIGIRISSAIAKFLSRITHDERAEQIRMISKAGKMGRNGRNCLKVFPICNRLLRLPTYSVPPILTKTGPGQ